MIIFLLMLLFAIGLAWFVGDIRYDKGYTDGRQSMCKHPMWKILPSGKNQMCEVCGKVVYESWEYPDHDN
jgi:hypothetical protein